MTTKLPPRISPPPAPRLPAGPARQGLVCWPAVAAAGGMALVCLVGLLCWVAAHPAAARTADRPAAPPAVKPAAPQPPAAAEVPAAESAAAEHRPHKHPSIRSAATRHRPPAERLPEEPKKSAPPDPAPPEPKKEPAPPPGPRSARPAAETYGTSVLFLSNPDEAARIAREENKLLFVLHVSGNFEDACFT